MMGTYSKAAPSFDKESGVANKTVENSRLRPLRDATPFAPTTSGVEQPHES
jgi:hypothetical protein